MDKVLSQSEVEAEAFRSINARIEEALSLRRRGKEGQAWIMIENLYAVLPEPRAHNRIATSSISDPRLNGCIKSVY